MDDEVFDIEPFWVQKIKILLDLNEVDEEKAWKFFIEEIFKPGDFLEDIDSWIDDLHDLDDYQSIQENW